MKIFQSIAFTAALLAGHTIALDAGVKQLFHVTVPRTIFDTALTKFGDDLDIWKTSLVENNNIQAQIYATEETINQFYATPKAKSLRTVQGTPLIQIVPDKVNTQQLLEESATVTAACTARTSRHLEATANSTAKYTDNAFFDCWRKPEEVFGFLDTLVQQNANVFSKIKSVATNIEGRDIPAYVLSTEPGKKAIYVEGLIHAREWHAGSTTFYAMAALLDGLRFNDPNIVSVVAKYDWYFVPIVNIDGFAFTHSPTGTRLWRKNRRPTKTLTGTDTFGVDLNRNFGPLEYFNRAKDSVTSDTYPGLSPLSEPETAGIYAFWKSLPLAGVLDLHSYNAQVLRPFGNREEAAPEPYGTKLKKLGDNVKAAIETNNTFKYESMTASDLYLSYGTAIDAVFLEFNNTAALTIEMEGQGFIQPESVIRPGGEHVFHGIVQFAKELDAYYS